MSNPQVFSGSKISEPIPAAKLPAVSEEPLTLPLRPTGQEAFFIALLESTLETRRQEVGGQKIIIREDKKMDLVLQAKVIGAEDSTLDYRAVAVAIGNAAYTSGANPVELLSVDIPELRLRFAQLGTRLSTNDMLRLVDLDRSVLPLIKKSPELFLQIEKSRGILASAFDVAAFVNLMAEPESLQAAPLRRSLVEDIFPRFFSMLEKPVALTEMKELLNATYQKLSTSGVNLTSKNPETAALRLSAKLFKEIRKEVKAEVSISKLRDVVNGAVINNLKR